MAPRVEKTEVLRKGWNFANRSYFASCIMRRHYFLLWMKERTFFFLIFTMELFSTALSYLTVQSTLNFTWTSLFFKQKHKSNIKGVIFELRSSHLIRDQPCKELLEVRCQACNFTGVLSVASAIEDFGHFFRPVFRRTSHT